jgi:hypothetical protein
MTNKQEDMRNEKTADKYSWAQWLSFCERLCPKTLSFSMLLNTVDFYRAYQNKVSHRRLMCEIEHVASLDWLTPEQREQRLTAVINNK